MSRHMHQIQVSDDLFLACLGTGSVRPNAWYEKPATGPLATQPRHLS